MLEFGWLANIAYIVAIRAYINSNVLRAKHANLIALALGLTSYLANEVLASPNSIKITGLGVGFYLWLLSFAILFVGCFYTKSLTHHSDREGLHR